jgi:hypothetical protein
MTVQPDPVCRLVGLAMFTRVNSSRNLFPSLIPFFPSFFQGDFG